MYTVNDIIMSKSEEEEFTGFPNADPTTMPQRQSKRLRLASRQQSLPQTHQDLALPAQQALTPDDPHFDESPEAARCLLCKQINPHKTRHMVKCDKCKLWCHNSCAEVTESQAQSIQGTTGAPAPARAGARHFSRPRPGKIHA